MYYHKGLNAKEKEAMFRAEMAAWKNKPKPKPKAKPKPKPKATKYDWFPPRRPKRIYSQIIGWGVDPDEIAAQYEELGKPSLLLPFKVGDEIGWARTVLVKAGTRMNTFKADLQTAEGRYYGSMNIRTFWNVGSHKHDEVKDVITDMKTKVYKFLMDLDEREYMTTDVELFKAYLTQQYNLPHDQE